MNKRALKFAAWLLAFAFPFIPVVAFAATSIGAPGTSGSGTPVWTLYTIGAGPALYGLLMSIKAMVNSSSYVDMVLFVAVIGGLFTASAGIITARPARVFGAITMIGIVSWLAFNITADVQIQDNSSGYTNVVTGVPALVAVPASALSEVGQYLTEKVEQDFSLPGFSALELSQGGLFNMSAQVIRALHTPVINDMPLKATFNNFFNDCVIPAVANGSISITQLMNASPGNSTGSLIDLMSAAASQSIMTTEYLSLPNNTANTATCATVYPLIKSTLTTEYPNILTNTMGQAFQVYGATGAGASFFSNAITGGFTWLQGGTASPSPQDLVMQSAVMDLMQGGFTYAAAQTGSSPVVASINIDQAVNQQKSSWWAAGQLFAKLGPMFYVVLYVFVIGISPVIIAALFIPHFGLAMASSYFKILLWLAIWQPSFAILNYILALFEQNASTTIMHSSGTWSFTTHTVLNQAANDYVLVGGFLGSLLPFVLYGLVNQGSMAITGFLEAASAKGAASAAGTSMSSGNLSLGQRSIDNTSMNHYDSALSRVTGSHGAMGYWSAGAAQAQIDSSGQWSSSAGRAATRTDTFNATQQISHQISQNQSAGHSYLSGTQTEMSQYSKSLHDYASSHGLKFDENGALAKGQSGSAVDAYNHALGLSTDIANKRQQLAQLTGKSTYGGKLGAGGGLAGMSAGAGAGYDSGRSDTASNQTSQGSATNSSMGSSSAKDFKSTTSREHKLLESIGHDIKALQDTQVGDQNALKKMGSSTDTFNTMVQRQSAYADTVSAATQLQGTTGIDLSNPDNQLARNMRGELASQAAGISGLAGQLQSGTSRAQGGVRTNIGGTLSAMNNDGYNVAVGSTGVPQISGTNLAEIRSAFGGDTRGMSAAISDMNSLHQGIMDSHNAQYVHNANMNAGNLFNGNSMIQDATGHLYSAPAYVGGSNGQMTEIGRVEMLKPGSSVMQAQGQLSGAMKGYHMAGVMEGTDGHAMALFNRQGGPSNTFYGFSESQQRWITVRSNVDSGDLGLTGNNNSPSDVRPAVHWAANGRP